MKTFLEVLTWIEWLSAGIGAVLVLLGIIAKILYRNFLGVTSFVNYFLVANSFFLMAIMLFLFIHFGQYKKE
jgi:hypothetical protein